MFLGKVLACAKKWMESQKVNDKLADQKIFHIIPSYFIPLHFIFGLYTFMCGGLAVGSLRG